MITTRTIQVGEYELLTNLAGDPSNSPLVFLHGSGNGATALSNWRRVMLDLEDEFYAIAPDQLGNGDSSHPDPPLEGSNGYMHARADTAVLLLDELGIDRATIVGNSMGGAVAQLIAIKYPERVDRLVMMGTALKSPDPRTLTSDGFYDDPTKINMRAKMDRYLFDPKTFASIADEITDERYPFAIRDDVKRSHINSFMEPTLPDRDEMSEVQARTLVMHGLDDQVIPLRASMAIVEAMPNADLLVAGRCGHWFQIERRELFVSSIRAFMAGDLDD